MAVNRLQIAAHRKVALTVQMAQHKKVCRQCTTLTPVRNRWCDEGWEIARQLAETASEITRLTLDQLGEQGYLL